jgi:hypothetical protein
MLFGEVLMWHKSKESLDNQCVRLHVGEFVVIYVLFKDAVSMSDIE